MPRPKSSRSRDIPTATSGPSELFGLASLLGMTFRGVQFDSVDRPVLRELRGVS
jgi:hypothetical protein